MSSLPPPSGGISTWTQILLSQGLAGVTFDLVDSSPSLHHLGRLRSLLAQAARTARIVGGLRRALRAGPAQGLHINMAPLAPGVVRDWACARMAARAGVPVVLHHHGLTSRLAVEPGAELRLRAVTEMARLARVNIVMNPPDREFVAGLTAGAGSEVVDIPNFYLEEALPAPRLDPRPAERRRRILFVAALSASKGTATVLELARAQPQWDFELIGRPAPEMGEALASAPANAEVVGELDRDATLERLVGADCFLFPTTHPEGFPYGVLEAMALGIPVVTTPVAALPVMVEDRQGGRVVEAELPELRAALEDVLCDEERRVAMGRFNRERARERYRFESVAGQLLEVYAGL